MSDERFTIETRFGDFEVTGGDVITFPRGLPGFEQTRRFVLLSHDTLAPLRCLHALDGSNAFLAVDPRAVLPDYECSLQPSQLSHVGADEDTPIVWLVLVSFASGDVATANLRAPVAINPTSMLGCQFVVDDERYPVRHELAA